MVFSCIQEVEVAAYNVDELISGEDYTRYIRNPNSLCIKESALEVESRTQAPVIKSLREYNDKCKYFSATDNCPIKATGEQCNRYANGDLFNGFKVTITDEGFSIPSPYERITGGTLDLSLSQSECEEYLTEITATSMSLIDNPSAPNGCYIAASGALLYYNSNGGNCETGRPCIQKRKYFRKSTGQPNESVSQTECQQFAGTIIGGAFAIADEIGNPKGCFAQNSAIYYNTNTDSTKECGAYGISNCVERYTLEIANKYISKVECANLPDYYGATSVSNYPYGCIYQTVGGGAQYKYQFNTNIDASGNCDHSAQNCAQKGPYSNEMRTDRPDGCYMDGNKYKYNEAVVYVDTGTPDMSLSLAECQQHAESMGQTWDSSVSEVSWSQSPKGCFFCGNTACTGSYEDIVIYNSKDSVKNCGWRAGDNCIQKGSPQHIWVSSGAPSLSLSQTECQAYATANGMTFYLKTDAAHARAITP